MTRKELNLAIFRREAAGAVLWQPRLEEWISCRIARNTLPAKFSGLDVNGIYDALGCSVRYGASAGLEAFYDGGAVETAETAEGNRAVTVIRTRGGELRTVYREVYSGGLRTNRRIEKYPVETRADLRLAADIMEHRKFRADRHVFLEAADRMGERGEPSLFTSSSGFTELIKHWAGLEGTFYLLNDYPGDVEAFVASCDRRDERLFEEALKLPCMIYNLGDHAVNEFTPPKILERFLLPRWQKISKRVHDAGRFVHSHWDGNCRHILGYLAESGLDSVEALTPAPMGDVTLEQIKEAVGDKLVVLDLLPAIYFLPNVKTATLLDFASRVIDMFAPRLVLGISDELPGPGMIEKVEAITEMLSGHYGLPG